MRLATRFYKQGQGRLHLTVLQLSTEDNEWNIHNTLPDLILHMEVIKRYKPLFKKKKSFEYHHNFIKTVWMKGTMHN